MIHPGLTSVTFRKQSPQEIVRWAAEAQLNGIEWGGDVHVPPGQIDTAREVAAMTHDAGMEMPSYGSYYRVGHDDPEDFQPVLDSALALGASIIRVWPGRVGSAEADEAYRSGVVKDGVRISELASQAGLRIACEWHGNTLTDTLGSALALFESADHPAFQTYWQPARGISVEGRLAEIDALRPRLAGLHIFNWDLETGQRLPLSEGEAHWKEYLAKASPAGDMFGHLEFVLDDDPQQMLRDAAALRTWLSEESL